MPIYLTEARNLPEEGKLRLTWDDGHTAEFEHGYLRGFCPCAGCQGHSRLEIEFHPPRGKAGIARVEAVGHYAISIGFEDGHGTGIYRFDFLRAICPCEECAPRRGGLHAAVSGF